MEGRLPWGEPLLCVMCTGNWVRDARPPTLIRRECIDLIVA